VLTAAGLACGFGCALLTPYPGSGDPAELLAASITEDGLSPFLDGEAQATLVNPAIDRSITVLAEKDPVVAIPGDAFTIALNYSAQNSNVIGGGIQFPDSDRVQWTLIQGIEGEDRGRIEFAYAVPSDICSQVPSLCHELETKQFAVARNVTPGGDVDEDGMSDGEFVVSVPDEVTVVLRCATCESRSCVEALPGGECLSCPQPLDCAAAYDICFAPERPKYGTNEAVQFEAFFGVDGVAWKSVASCLRGEDLCRSALDSAERECLEEGGTTDAEEMDAGEMNG